MRIAIDGYEANVPARLGSSQIAFELLRHLEKIDKENEYTILLPNSPMEDLPKERENWRYKILKPVRLWTRIALPLYLYTTGNKVNIFFSPTHYIPRFSPTSMKKVATIFDLSFLHFPQMFNKKDLWQLTNWTKFSAQNADHIITISNFSKKDIIKQYGIDGRKITVTYPGFNKEVFKPIAKELKNKYETEDSYIMYIGTIQPRKNLVRLMEAVARIDNINLIIAGKTEGEGRKGWMYKETLQTPKRLGIEDRVKFLGYVPTQDLPPLLSRAKIFVQPSLYEGFGIPVIEAMASGVPVIVANVSSLPEVVGKAGLTFDPYSVDQIEQAIRTLLSDHKLRTKYRKLGLIQAQKFSWDKMAKEILKVFASV